MPFNELPRLRLAALSLGLVLAATACGGDDGEPSSSPGGEEPTAVVESPTPTLEPAPSTPASPSAPGTPLPSPATLTDRLLSTDQVPGLNAGWVWQDGETGPAGAEPFGLCSKVDLASIGATEVVERTFFPPVDTDDSASEQLADFPDASTAARAAAVLKSWHKQCRATVGKSGVKIGAITPVPVSTGVGSWYLVSYPEGNDEGRFHAFGVVTSGTRVALLSIDNGGQDYNYARGKEPMVAMLRAASSRLS